MCVCVGFSNLREKCAHGEYSIIIRICTGRQRRAGLVNQHINCAFLNSCFSLYKHITARGALLATSWGRSLKPCEQCSEHTQKKHYRPAKMCSHTDHKLYISQVHLNPMTVLNEKSWMWEKKTCRLKEHRVCKLAQWVEEASLPRDHALNA